MKLRIVELTDGRFAVQCRYSFSPLWRFIDSDRPFEYNWLSTRTISMYCVVDTIEKAERVMEVALVRLRIRSTSRIKIKRIIKTVKV